MTSLYRYEDRLYASALHEFDYPTGPSTVHVELRTFEVLKTTPKGAWIVFHNVHGKRFINLSARKCYVCATIEEAMESYKHRKRRQIRILSRQLETAKKALSIASGNVSLL